MPEAAVPMWWQYVVAAVVALLVVYSFLTIVGVRTRGLTRRTNRTAADLYDEYADSPRTQRRYARRHGGSWRDDEGGPRRP